MQVKKPIKFHLPQVLTETLLDKLKSSPPKFSYKVEYFYYVARYLTFREIQRKDDEYYFINYKKLASATVTNIRAYVCYLQKWGIIELGKNDRYGKNNGLGFRLNPNLLYGVVLVEIKESRLYDKLTKLQSNLSPNKHADRLEPHIRESLNLFKSIDLDYEAARNWIDENADGNKLYYYHSMLNTLEDKRFRYFSRSKSNGRLNSNLSTLKKELKQFLIGDWVQIDLKNSQPFFLSQFLGDLSSIKTQSNIEVNSNILYIQQEFKKKPCKVFGISRLRGAQKTPIFESGELLRIQNSCNKGTFYEDLMQELNDPGLSRDDVKKIVLPMLYSNNFTRVKNGERKGKMTTPYYKEKEKFKQVYPNIAKVLRALKDSDNSILPIFMQYLESYVFIDCILPELVSNGIVPLTIHDSVIIKSNQQQQALEIIKKVFLELFGVIPSFHVEPLKK